MNKADDAGLTGRHVTGNRQRETKPKAHCGVASFPLAEHSRAKPERQTNHRPREGQHSIDSLALSAEADAMKAKQHGIQANAAPDQDRGRKPPHLCCQQ